ncbi:YIP1 family protein [Paenibacillus eucommiae]|uniref:DNA-binding beta-propeller fold protein YncE n=1 Tax=Paenibacillus eucommiae TaxID=1355755 RepID=A0ABS4IR16_9BACL|nr:YIP1 family protein [Paenibacillus eucommiae]MBP1989446.1 DNA-binding beta-propeller fold protein YncE [Paenibacillus eucommiae]
MRGRLNNKMVSYFAFAWAWQHAVRQQSGEKLFRQKKACFALLLLITLAVTLQFPTATSARLPYNTWFVDQETNRQVRIQPVYVPSQVVGYSDIDVPLLAPNDLYITADDHVYVADTGNNRIVEYDEQGRFLRAVGTAEGDGALNAPEGVFVTKDGMIYIADTGNKRIAVYDAGGVYVRAFEKPQSVLLPEGYFYVPTKLVVDNRGVMYVVNKDSYQGLLRMNEEGKFTGFFGANKTEVDWLTRLKRTILNQTQMDKEIAKRPGAIANVAMTSDGFLLTTSYGVAKGQIKKLNAGGADAFLNKPYSESKLVDTAIDADRFLYGMNSEFGEISIYDPYGNALVYFGDMDKLAHQQGIVNFPTSVAINSKKELWVADSSLNLLQVYKRTAFGEAFLTASKLYVEGSYEESKPYWEAVMKENGMMNLPYNGLGEIALFEKRYAKSMSYFKDSYDAAGYSDAFWNIRYDWIQSYLIYSILVLIFLIVLLRFLFRKIRVYVTVRSWPPFAAQYGGEAKDAWYLMFHPYEGFYRLKERKISVSMILTLLLLTIGIRILSIYGMGFIFHPYDLSKVNLVLEVCLLIVPWITWIIANYLVSTVKGGEGRFREVLQASTYALVPYIVLMIPAILLSNIVVLEERIVVDSIIQVMWIWIAVQFFIMTQVIHNFDFLEAAKNAGITLFTIGVIWIFVVIMSGLSYNLFDFVKQIYREVTFYA